MAAAGIPRRQIFVRPRSEVITVLDWRQVSNDRAEQWRSETCLDEKFFENEERFDLRTGYVCGSYEFTREDLEESESEMTGQEETDVPACKSDLKRSVLKINLKPSSVQVKPRLVKAQSMASLPRREEFVSGNRQSKEPDKSKLNRRKSSLDVSLAKLRHEMVSTNGSCFR